MGEGQIGDIVKITITTQGGLVSEVEGKTLEEVLHEDEGPWAGLQKVDENRDSYMNLRTGLIVTADYSDDK